MAALEGLKRKLADDEEGLRLLQQLAKRLKPEEPDVFNVAPNEIVKVPKRALKRFSMKYGLIEIIFDDMPAYDPFQHRAMDKYALSAVHACFGRQGCWTATKAYNDPKQEDQSGGVHAVMILGFRPFTRSRQSSNNRGKCDMLVEICDPEGDKQEDGVEEKADDYSEDSNMSLLIEDQSGGAKAREKADNKLLVFSPKYISPASPDSTVPANPEGVVLSTVCGRKTAAEMEHLLQSGAYGLDSLLHNTHDKDKFFRPPVVLEVWDANIWYYGILEVDYFVRAKDGTITEVSLNQFPAAKTSPIGRKFTRCFTRDEVTGLFSKWQTGLQENAAKIPDRLHPVGRLYIRKKHFPMPRYAKDAATPTVGAKRFYEGNLKQLVGKSVCKWTDKDVVRAFYSRNEEQKELHDETEARPWVKEALFPEVDVDALAAKFGL